MSDKPTLLCIDCKHLATPPITIPDNARCGHPNLIDPVNGTPMQLRCREMRDIGSQRCGPHGTWFEKREQRMLDRDEHQGGWQR